MAARGGGIQRRVSASTRPGRVVGASCCAAYTQQVNSLKCLFSVCLFIYVVVAVIVVPLRACRDVLGTLPEEVVMVAVVVVAAAAAATSASAVAVVQLLQTFSGSICWLTCRA